MGRFVAAILIAAIVAACAQAPPPRFNLAGYSPAFKSGHADGCASAGGAVKRDERRFKADVDYMMGWNDGRSACGR